jgi:signal peptidase I
VKSPNPEFLILSQDILSQGTALRFQAKGLSMFPAIRNGDILTVQLAGSAEIRPGDIIFYHGEGARIAAHRVRKIILSNEGAVFMTRGDFYLGHGEGIPWAKVLGKVCALERKGRQIDISRGWGRLKDRFYSFSSPLIVMARKITGRLLPRVQGFAIYRSLAARLLKAEIVYCREPLADGGERVLAKAGEVVIGQTTVSKFADADKDSGYQGWWIFGTWVSWRYRRLGIGRQLTIIASEAAAKNGVAEVKLLVFQDNQPALNLYRKLGFSPIIIPRISAELEEEAKETGRQRIIMKKDLM